MEQDDDGRADPLTRLIGQRVAALRKEANLNQTALGERMSKLRPTWSRSTVAKLESNKRGAVTVADLFALAVALEVPPVWLLCDPSVDAVVPLAKDVSADSWAALMWATGRAPLNDTTGAWLNAEVPLRQATTIATVVENYRLHASRNDITSAVVPDQFDEEAAVENERRLLRGLVRPMKWLLDNGYRLPVLPGDVVERARELGVDLPKQEG